MWEQGYAAEIQNCQGRMSVSSKGIADFEHVHDNINISVVFGEIMAGV